MILEHIRALNEKHIVLASASPRRAQLLRQIGLANFEIVPSSFAEDLDKQAHGGPSGYAKETARCKALDVRRSLRSKAIVPDLIISADTVVEIDGLVLEKPADSDEAMSMLLRMSGREHQVHTGFTIMAPCISDSSIVSSSTTTEVTFGKLTRSEVQAYIETGECFGKAGAYGAQGPAGVWIQSLKGCYFNVMGLPLHDIASAISELLLRDS